MIKYLIIAFILTAISFSNENPEIETQVSKFREILRLVDENYVDSVDINELSEKSFKMMLQSLDKQSYYFNQEEYARIKNKTGGKSEVGIGVKIEVIGDTVVVTNVIKDSPADSSGIGLGDIIIFVDGKSMIGVSESEANDILKGEINTTANIIYKTFEKRELKEANISRSKTNVSVIDASFLVQNSDIGYIKVRTFSGRTSQDLKDSLQNLKDLGLKKLIIDLRDNEGGVLQESVNAAGLFIDGKQVITRTKSKNSVYDKKMIPEVESEFKDLSLIVLINEKSASASEIFAGAIQDYDRGLVCGSVSYGKGTVQKAWEFKDSTAFRITISRWVTPSGRPVELKKDKKIDVNSLGVDEQLKSNIAAAIEKFGVEKSEIYETFSGRKIFAVNGIYPDVFVKSDTLTLLTKVMMQKNIFQEHALEWVRLKGKEIESNFDDYPNFYENYKIDKECLDLLAKILQDNNTFNQEMYNKDKFKILNFIKANIAKLIWGESAYQYIQIQLDKQIIAAIQNFPKATQMINN